MNDDPSSWSTPPKQLPRGGGSYVAYHCTPGKAPGVIFLGGFRSDMTGTKALALEEACAAAGRHFIRFDYFGHGASSGDFGNGTVSRWREDALAVLDTLTEGPQVLVGSSMGGWIRLLVALARPDRVAGMVGIAAAPDFTEKLMWETFDDGIRTTIERDGVYHEESPYDAEPTPITRDLIEDGRRHLLLDRAIPFAGPVRLLHGTADTDVPWQHSLRTAEALTSADVVTLIVKNGDHRLSATANLRLLTRTVDEVCWRVR